MSCACRGHGAQDDDDMRTTCALGPILGPSWAPKKGTRGPQEGPKRGPRGPKKQQKIKRNLSPTKKRFLLNFSAFAAIRGYLPPHLPLGIPRTTTNVRDDERRTTANGQRRRRRRTAKNQWKINDFCLLAFWLPMAIRGLKMAPRRPKRAPREAQESPKTAPRAPKSAPRAPDEAVLGAPKGGR